MPRPLTPDEPHPMTPADTPPAEIGSYRIQGTIGKGGMGIVYRAEHAQTHEVVALKTVRVVYPSEMAGIRAEVLALSRLRHPGVVQILEGGVHEGKPWYAMELLMGRPMTDWLADLW